MSEPAPPPAGMTVPAYTLHLRTLAHDCEARGMPGLATDFRRAASVVEWLHAGRSERDALSFLDPPRAAPAPAAPPAPFRRRFAGGQGAPEAPPPPPPAPAAKPPQKRVKTAPTGGFFG